MRKLKYSLVIVFIVFIISLVCSLYFPSMIASHINKAAHVSKVISKGPNQLEPQIVGESAITMDLNNNEVIYSKDANAKRYPASLTKLMTAYLFGVNAKPTDEIPYTEQAMEQPAFSLDKNFGGVKVGDTMEASEVMKALLLYSANDAAYMIADYVGGDKTNFVNMMNETAKEWGLTGTHFMNPNGLNNPNHYTTAYDMAIIAKHAYLVPWVREAMNTKKATIKFNQSNKDINIENRNANLDKDGNVGGKTGFTLQAGHCLVNIDVRNGQTIVGVVMKSGESETSPQVFEDMNKIMDYSFNEAKPVVYQNAGAIVAVPTIKYKVFGFFGPTVNIKTPIKLDENIMYYNNSENNENSNIEVDTNNLSAWKATTDPINVKFSELQYNKDYKGTAEITKAKLIEISIFPYLTVIFGVIFVILLIISISKKKKKA